MALEDELLDLANYHSKLLRGVYLLEHANRRECHLGNADPPILDGIPSYRMASPHLSTCESVPPTPPPSPCEEGTSNQEIFVDCVKPEDEEP
jgi:hypothetical protein